jgi:hypothetical protein
MIQLTQAGPLLSASTAELEQLRDQFDRQHCVKLPGFLPPALLQLVQARIAEEQFYERSHEEIGPNKELCLTDGFAPALLLFLLNNSALFQLIQFITRCQSIGCFEGRIYRVAPGCGHQDAWHNDLVEHRLVALSLNLSTDIYAGGVLQLRDWNTGEIIQQAANTGAGDALVFRLASHLKHRITEVEGAFPKTAFAGWFKSEPSFLSLLKSQAGPL